MEHTIEVKGLSKRFTMHILNDKVIHAIQNLDFFIKEGEIVGLAKEHK